MPVSACSASDKNANGHNRAVNPRRQPHAWRSFLVPSSRLPRYPVRTYGGARGPESEGPGPGGQCLLTSPPLEGAAPPRSPAHAVGAAARGARRGQGQRPPAPGPQGPGEDAGPIKETASSGCPTRRPRAEPCSLGAAGFRSRRRKRRHRIRSARARPLPGSSNPRPPSARARPLPGSSNPRPPSARARPLPGSSNPRPPSARARPLPGSSQAPGSASARRDGACVLRGGRALTRRRPLSLPPFLAAKMALSRVCWARAALWGSAVAPGPFVTRRLQLGRSGPAWRAPRPSKLHLSPKADAKDLISYLVAKTRDISGTYHRFLGRHFPRFYALYTVFMKGIQMLWADAKQARRIKKDMRKRNIKFHQLSYRDMEHLRQFRRDVTKCLFIGVVSIPPFANYVVFLLMYLFPRQLLVKHFWSPKQQVDFLDIYHSLRKQSHSDVITHLGRVSAAVSHERLRWRLTDLCTKVQNGTHPAAHDVLPLRECFSTHPLGLSHLQAPQMKALSRAVLLTPHLPPPLLRWRLKNHATVIHQLDRALAKLGIGQLTAQEVKSACYLRGLNSTHIAEDRCRTWLGEWLQISCSLKEAELSLLLHNVVLLSTNYLEPRR